MSDKKYTERIPALLDEEPITFYPNLAVVFGVNEAIVLQQIYFYMNVNRKKRSNRHYRDSKWWVYNSYQQWIDEHFPWLSLRGLQTVILGLEKQGVILTMQGVENPRDRRKWYSIDLEKMHAIVQNRAMHHTKNVSWDDTKNVSSNAQEMCDVYTENTSETTTERKEKDIAPAVADRDASDSHRNPDIAPATVSSAAVITHPLEGNENSATAEKAHEETPETTPTHPLPLPAPAEVAPVAVKTSAVKDETTETDARPETEKQRIQRLKVDALVACGFARPLSDKSWGHFNGILKTLTQVGMTYDMYADFHAWVKEQSAQGTGWKVTLDSLVSKSRPETYMQEREARLEKERKQKELEEKIFAQYPDARPADPNQSIEYMPKEEALAMMSKLLNPTRQENVS